MVSKQDILTAVKHLDAFLKVPALKGAEVRLNKNGSPFVYTGGFNMVFQLSHCSKKWAFRVWHVPMGEQKDRYKTISKYLTKSDLPYFADFVYDEKGLLVNGELNDTIRMEWLDGIVLKDYIEQHLNDRAKLEQLANDFLEMSKALRANKISHGDLQEGNIIVDNSGKIKLVDYDSICIPEIEGQADLVTGLKGYQHPSRFKSNEASLKADYFSELIIYLSIFGIAAKPELWDKYKVKDTQYLLFSETDLKNIISSQIYSDLKGHSVFIDKLLHILVDYLNTAHFRDLKPLTDYLAKPDVNINQNSNYRRTWPFKTVMIIIILAIAAIFIHKYGISDIEHKIDDQETYTSEGIEATNHTESSINLTLQELSKIRSRGRLEQLLDNLREADIIQLTDQRAPSEQRDASYLVIINPITQQVVTILSPSVDGLRTYVPGTDTITSNQVASTYRNMGIYRFQFVK